MNALQGEQGQPIAINNQCFFRQLCQRTGSDLPAKMGPTHAVDADLDERRRSRERERGLDGRGDHRPGGIPAGSLGLLTMRDTPAVGMPGAVASAGSEGPKISSSSPSMSTLSSRVQDLTPVDDSLFALAGCSRPAGPHIPQLSSSSWTMAFRRTRPESADAQGTHPVSETRKSQRTSVNAIQCVHTIQADVQQETNTMRNSKLYNQYNAARL